MGNLIPLLCMAPFAGLGAFFLSRDGLASVPGILLCSAALVVGWFAVNQFGFFGNAILKREIGRKVLPKAGRDASSGTFVGFARPAYMGLLDAHEDLGFLFLTPESLEYVGEIHQVSIQRGEVKEVGYRGNVHSALGLGRWVSIEAEHKGKPVRLLVEPREAKTLLGNKKLGIDLRRRIEQWRKTRPSS